MDLAAKASRLRELLEEHSSRPFPIEPARVTEIDGVDLERTDTDICGWAEQWASEGAVTHDVWRPLRSAAFALKRAIPSVPEDAQSYFRELLDIARLALSLEIRDYTWSELQQAGARPEEWTELGWAIECENVDEMRRLLEAGADPNERCIVGGLPLHWAISTEGINKSYGREDGCEMTKLLLAYGADITATNRDGDNALDVARKFLDTGAEAAVLEAINEQAPPPDRRP